MSAGLLSISEANMGLEKNQSSEAYYYASACAEEALQQIHDSVSFSGSGNLSMGNGNCNYTVTAGAGHNRTIEASGIVETIVRKIRITIDKIQPDINIVSWEEVADF